MPWASMLYNLEFLSGGALSSNGSTGRTSTEALPSHAFLDEPMVFSKPTKSFDAELSMAMDDKSVVALALSDASPPHTPRKPCRKRDSSSLDADLNGSPVQCELPQRPGMAVMRNSPRGYGHRTASTIRSPTRSRQSCEALPAHLTPITNHGLRLPSHAGVRSTCKPRSQDRIRAAQRLFRALGQSSRTDQAADEEQYTSSTQARPRASFLYNLSAQAHRRNSKLKVHEKASEPDVPQFTSTMHGTQQCVIATQSSTFELVITPPSPKPDHESNDTGVTGVRITSHRSHEPISRTPPSPWLEPPPFELAPGRARHIAEQKRRASAPQLAQQTKPRPQSTISAPNPVNTPAQRALAPLQPANVQAGLVPRMTYSPPKEVLLPRHCAQMQSLDGINPSMHKYIPPVRRRRMPMAASLAPMPLRHVVPSGH